MVQVIKRTMDVELFGGLNPGTVRVSTEKFKSRSYFNQMCHFHTRNCRI